MTWYPPVALNAMRGEQIDLVDAANSTYVSVWTRNAASNGVTIDHRACLIVPISIQSSIPVGK